MATRDFKGFLLRKNLEKKQSIGNKIVGKQKAPHFAGTVCQILLGRRIRGITRGFFFLVRHMHGAWAEPNRERVLSLKRSEQSFDIGPGHPSMDFVIHRCFA